MSPFKDKVIEIVSIIPHGTVVSYGQVAAMAGVPRAARHVGWILNASETDESIQNPWWSVINNAGVISIKGTKYNDKLVQAEMIRSEGIPVTDTYELDIEKYRFRPDEQTLKQLKLSDDYIEILMGKYGI